MNDFTSTLGLLRREFRDTHAVVSNIDLRTRRMVEPRSIARPGGLVARLCACAVLSRTERVPLDDIVKRHFGRDAELAQLLTMKTATGPAMTSGTGWATELVTDVVMDIVNNLLPDTALAQLTRLGVSYAFTPGGGLVRAPTHQPSPSGPSARATASRSPR
jgi:hypothetical protein